MQLQHSPRARGRPFRGRKKGVEQSGGGGEKEEGLTPVSLCRDGLVRPGVGFIFFLFGVCIFLLGVFFFFFFSLYFLVDFKCLDWGEKKRNEKTTMIPKTDGCVHDNRWILTGKGFPSLLCARTLTSVPFPDLTLIFVLIFIFVFSLAGVS